MIMPCNFSIYDTTTWVLDTGSPIYICNSLQGLQVSRWFKDSKRFLNVGDRSSVPVLALGVIEFVFESCTVMLNECHYCPKFMLNINFVDLLASFDYEITIKYNFLNIIMNDVIVMTG